MHNPCAPRPGHTGRRCQLIPRALRDYWAYLLEDDRLAEFLRLAGPLLVALVELLRLLHAVSMAQPPRY